MSDIRVQYTTEDGQVVEYEVRDGVESVALIPTATGAKVPPEKARETPARLTISASWLPTGGPHGQTWAYSGRPADATERQMLYDIVNELGRILDDAEERGERGERKPPFGGSPR